MRVFILVTALLIAYPCLADSLFECSCFGQCSADWTLDGMVIDGCTMSNPVGEWHSAQVGEEDWQDYLVTIEVYTGNGTTVYFDAMGEVVAFFVSSENTYYAVLLDYGTEHIGTNFGPGPYHASWWNVQFGYIDGSFVYRHWPLGDVAPQFIDTYAPSSGLLGSLAIRAYSGEESATFRSLRVVGVGSVANHVTTWRQLKAYYR